LSSPTALPLSSRLRSFVSYRVNFWTVVMALIVAIIAILLIWPIYNVLKVGLIDGESGKFTFGNYALIFTHKYYVGAIINTLVVGTLGMLGACILGIPFAYILARYKIKARVFVSTLAVLALVSPPFIGAYAWIMMLGSNGMITRALKSFGIQIPSIYGMTGIVLVFSFKFYPFVYLMTEAALKSINRSFEEAAENLGCSPFERFTKVTLPLVFPAVSTGAILCFILSIADFGTPSIIGRGYRTLATIAYNQYTSELGGQPTLAVTISTIMIAISMALVLLQRQIIGKRRYSSSLTNKPEQKTPRGLHSAILHLIIYTVAFIGFLPAIVVIYTSFLKTSGPVFSGGFGLGSYINMLDTVPDVIMNSFKFSLIAVAMITIVSSLIAYIITRRESTFASTLDTVMMVPYVVPGVVMAIGFVITFNTAFYDIVGTSTIIILIIFIRRLPYGVRGSSSVLRQIKPSIEEAAINMGASPAKAFWKMILPLMAPGVIAGAMMSFITAINELSSSLILYRGATMTMPVRTYIAVLDGEFGMAAALSTLLLISTGICVYIVFHFSKSKEGAFI
jgi:iron(III) transport system permease protein